MPARRTEGSGSHNVLEITTTFTIMVITVLCASCSRPLKRYLSFITFIFSDNGRFAVQRHERAAFRTASRTARLRNGPAGMEPNGASAPRTACEHASCKKGARSAASSPRPERPSISAGRPLARRDDFSRSTARPAGPLARRSRSLGKQPGFGSHPARQPPSSASSPTSAVTQPGSHPAQQAPRPSGDPTPPSRSPDPGRSLRSWCGRRQGR